MSNSQLVEYKRISPNSSNPRNHKIDTLTIHHMAGIFSLETVGDIFASGGRGSSANYAIDKDGRVGMYVEEKNRAWTSSSRSNDHRAVTIEVSNDMIGGDWHVSDKALAKTIELCIDICKRNDIKKLNFTGDTKGNLTMHKWFANTACPGKYLGSKFPYIAEEVNKELSKSIVATSPIDETKIIKPVKTIINVNLMIGNKGDMVKELQSDLIKLGFSVGKGVDGLFGNNTKNGVKSFQRKYKLKVDGIAGKNTLGKIDELIKETNKKPVQVSKPKAKLKVDGYMGENTIKAIQIYFGTIVDGEISNPSLVVKEIQKVVGAKVDGIIGVDTIKKMQKHFGTPQDGIISEPSLMVKAMQKRLNEGKF